MSSVAATVPCSSLALDLCPASGEVNICWHERPTVEEKMSYLMIPYNWSRVEILFQPC